MAEDTTNTDVRYKNHYIAGSRVLSPAASEPPGISWEEFFASGPNLFEPLSLETNNGDTLDGLGDYPALVDVGNSVHHGEDIIIPEIIPDEQLPQKPINSSDVVNYTDSVATCSTQAQHAEDGDKNRRRGPDYTYKETKAMLKAKLKWSIEVCAMRRKKSFPSWSYYVSKELLTKGFDRNYKSVQQRWDTCYKGFKQIDEFNEKNQACYWDMDEKQRSNYDRLPKEFPKRYFTLMKTIFLVEAAPENTSVKKRQTKKRSRTEVGPMTTSTSTQNASSVVNPSSQDQRILEDPQLLAKLTPSINKLVEAAIERQLSMLSANHMRNTIPVGAQAGVAYSNVDTTLLPGLEDTTCPLED